jgi:hypothetical protein
MVGTRKIVAILVADIVRLPGGGENRTLSRPRGLRSDLIDPPSTRNNPAMCPQGPIRK